MSWFYKEIVDFSTQDAQNTCAMLTTFNEIDMTNIIELRNTYKDVFQKKHGIKLGYGLTRGQTVSFNVVKNHMWHDAHNHNQKSIIIDIKGFKNFNFSVIAKNKK